jgi:hypothetical protein
VKAGEDTLEKEKKKEIFPAFREWVAIVVGVIGAESRTFRF